MTKELSFKNLNKLAIPALLAGITEPLISITDTAIIGNIEQYPVQSLAATGIVGSFISMLIWIFGQSRSAISSIISQYLGANNLKSIKDLPAQSVSIIVLLSIILISVLYPLSASIFKLYNANGIILELCLKYFKIRILGLPFALFTFGIFGVFRGLQNTYYPMIIAITGAVLNVILDYILVYGINGYLNGLDIEGAAIASTIAQITMALMSFMFLKYKSPFSLKIKFPIHSEMKKFTLMIVNLFIRTFALNVVLYIGNSFATKYGENYIAAYTIGINIWFLGAFIIDGYSSAGNILAGKFYGAKQYKSLIELSNKLLIYGISLGILIMGIGFITYQYIPILFTQNSEVLETFYQHFWIVLIMQPICAVAFIFDGMFKGLGEMKFLRNVLLVSSFLLFLPVALTFDYLGYNLDGLFIALFIWVIARGVPLVIKFRKLFLPLV